MTKYSNMKSTILALVTILVSSMTSAQSQLPFKADSTVAPKLGFNKQNYWSLPLKDSIVIKGFDYCIPKNGEQNLATTSYNMPVVVPKGNHSMPIYAPDTTVSYKKRVFNID